MNRNLRQQAMIETWERHMAAEFVAKSVEASMATMTAEPFVNHVPVMTGGVGYEAVKLFYATSFLPGHPPDTETIPVMRTVGDNAIVDELIYRFTHTIEMPWMLPGVAPTGRQAEVAITAVVLFEGDKISGERIYWDQASVLVQLGLIDERGFPVTGIDSARKAADVRSEPSNSLIARAA